MRERVRELGKMTNCDLWLEDHGCLVLGGEFHYEDGGVQGIGRIMTIDALKQFMQVFNVEYLRSVNGKTCWVTHDFNGIYKLEPLHNKDGVVWNMEEKRNA